MAASASRYRPSTKFIPSILTIHLLLLVTICHCIDEDATLFGFNQENPNIDIDGFKVDPNLIEETIDDTLRSKSESERTRESVSTSTRHPFEHICPYGYFACNNGECIAPRWRCDGHYDCDDFSDELNCTSLDIPQHGSIALPSSAIYTAPPARPNASTTGGLDGETLMANAPTQVYGLDFNSTVEPLMIFSTGTSIRGLWMRARIYFDIVIRNKSRTVAATQPTSITDAFSLFFGMFGADSQSSAISAASPSSTSAGSGKSSTSGDGGDSQQKPDNTIVGLDMDPNNKEVFWVELGKEPGVYSAVIEDEQFEARHRRQFHGYKKVVEFGLISPEDIALDIVGRNAYITDAGLPAVVVCSYVHVHCKIIQQDKIHKPRAIIADSASGWITFTDWGDRPGIYLQSMDGFRFETLIDSDVVWPNGLAADHNSNYLYWADARLNKIERVDLVTRQRKVLIKEVNTNPFSVSMFENRIFWSDWSKNVIKTCNKVTGNGTQILMHADDIYGIHIYHPDLHRDDVSNPCWSKHCSHLCLLSPTTKSYTSSLKGASSLRATCACPDSMALSILDKATCYEVELAFLLINVRNYVAQVFPERIGLRVVEEIVYSRQHAIQDIASDWIHYRLFFFDASRREIYLADFSGRQPTFENFTSLTSKSIRGFLFDYMSDNLFWLDPDVGTLNMYSLKGNFQRVLRRNLEKPTSMVLDTRNRVFYIASLGSKPHIMRTDVTGQEQSDVVLIDRTTRDGTFGLPVALHLDEHEQRLYWADAHMGTIESLDLDVKSRSTGTKVNSRKVHRRRLGTILSFAVYHRSFMWTVQNEGFVYKADIAASKKNSRPVAYKLPPNPSVEHLTSDYQRLITVNPLFEAATSACHTATCSHGCLLDSSHSAKCLCPENYKLSILNRTNCIEQSREETTPMPLPTAAAQVSNGGNVAEAVAVTPNKNHVVPGAGVALSNIITHLDGLGPMGVEQKSKSAPGSSRPASTVQKPEFLKSLEESEMNRHEALAPKVNETIVEGQQQGEPKNESNRVVWLIVFLLILSAAGVVTVLSLLVMHRQGRLPHQVSVSFISPGSSLGGSRTTDKDRAMLLLDTDN